MILQPVALRLALLRPVLLGGALLLALVETTGCGGPARTETTRTESVVSTDTGAEERSTSETTTVVDDGGRATTDTTTTTHTVDGEPTDGSED
jgi:hypothetical protein